MNETVNLNLDKAGLEYIGKHLMEGALSGLGKWVIIAVLAIVIIGAAADHFRVGFDSTDDRAAGKRSGVSLRTDHGTGCQYLETSQGGLTPRLTREGKHYCN